MLTTLLIGATIFALSFYTEVTTARKLEVEKPRKITPSSPPCLRLFNSIEKYAEKYNIPKKFAYGVAYIETHYEGPFHWAYDHRQSSGAGAVGPMQVMLPTAKFLFPNRKISREKLKTDIDLNVECSMKLLRRLYDQYGNWKLVFGAYNTGKPLINSYALSVYNFDR